MGEEAWTPVVDEPIGDLVDRILEHEPDFERLLASPRHRLALRTFAHIRVGLLLGELLVEHELEPERSRTWVDQLLAEPLHRDAVVAEVRAVARDVASDPSLGEPEADPAPEARERFRRFLRESRRD